MEDFVSGGTRERERVPTEFEVLLWWHDNQPCRCFQLLRGKVWLIIEPFHLSLGASEAGTTSTSPRTVHWTCKMNGERGCV
jgi:hypothetical protein